MYNPCAYCAWVKISNFPLIKLACHYTTEAYLWWIGAFLKKPLVSKIQTWKGPILLIQDILYIDEKDVTFLSGQLNTDHVCIVVYFLYIMYKLGLQNGGDMGWRYTA